MIITNSLAASSFLLGPGACVQEMCSGMYHPFTLYPTCQYNSSPSPNFLPTHCTLGLSLHYCPKKWVCPALPFLRTVHWSGPRHILPLLYFVSLNGTLFTQGPGGFLFLPSHLKPYPSEDLVNYSTRWLDIFLWEWREIWKIERQENIMQSKDIFFSSSKTNNTHTHTHTHTPFSWGSRVLAVTSVSPWNFPWWHWHVCSGRCGHQNLNM